MLHDLATDGGVEAPERIHDKVLIVVIRKNDERAVGPQIVKRGAATGGVGKKFGAVSGETALAVGQSGGGVVTVVVIRDVILTGAIVSVLDYAIRFCGRCVGIAVCQRIF